MIIKANFDSIVYFICIYSTVHSKLVQPAEVVSTHLRQDLDGQTVSCSNCSGDGDTYFDLLKYHTIKPTINIVYVIFLYFSLNYILNLKNYAVFNYRHICTAFAYL